MLIRKEEVENINTVASLAMEGMICTQEDVDLMRKVSYGEVIC